MNGTSDGPNNQHESNPQPVTRPDPAEPAVSTERTRHDELIDRIKKSERVMIGLTALIALTGIWGGYVIYEQLKVTEGQLAEMKSGSADTKTIAESAKTQADNTRILASAAIDQVQELKASVQAVREANQSAHEAMILDQRAWVGIKEMKVVTFEVNKPIQIKFMMTNSGKTFARQVVSVIHRVIARTDRVIDIDQMAKDLPRQQDKKHKVIFPNLEMTLTQDSSFALNEAQFTGIKNRTLAYYVFGHISYVDVFNKNHLTEFCGVYDTNSRDLILCDQHQSAT